MTRQEMFNEIDLLEVAVDGNCFAERSIEKLRAALQSSIVLSKEQAKSITSFRQTSAGLQAKSEIDRQLGEMK